MYTIIEGTDYLESCQNILGNCDLEGTEGLFVHIFMEI